MVKKLAERIRHHPIAAFFVLAYGITWPPLIVVLFLLPESMVAQGLLGSIAVFGPALAGVAVSRVSHPGSRAGSRAGRLCAFASALAVAAAVLVLFLWQVRGVSPNVGVLVFATLLAVLPAYVVSGAFSRSRGVREYLRALVRPKGSLIWYLIALLTFPAVQLLGVLITRVFGSAVEIDTGGHSTQAVLGVAVLTFLHGFFFAGGINEETGWRGFALPQLQSRYCPLVAASIVWIFWALWHLPYDLASGDSAVQILQNRVFFNFLWSILFAWVYNRSNGSVLAPALFHPAMNTSGSMLPRTDAATVLFVVLTVFAVVYDRMWCKPPPVDPDPARHMMVRDCLIRTL
jgi:membrane protease YdiL (CAAX protease family)